MKASAVFVHQSEPRATLRASDTDFFAIQMTSAQISIFVMKSWVTWH